MRSAKKIYMQTLNDFFLQLHVSINVEMLGAPGNCYLGMNYSSFDTDPYSNGSGISKIWMYSCHKCPGWRRDHFECSLRPNGHIGIECIGIDTLCIKFETPPCSQRWLRDVRRTHFHKVVPEGIRNCFGHLLRFVGQINEWRWYFCLPLPKIMEVVSHLQRYKTKGGYSRF